MEGMIAMKDFVPKDLQSRFHLVVHSSIQFLLDIQVRVQIALPGIKNLVQSRAEVIQYLRVWARLQDAARRSASCEARKDARDTLLKTLR